MEKNTAVFPGSYYRITYGRIRVFRVKLQEVSQLCLPQLTSAFSLYLSCTKKCDRGSDSTLSEKYLSAIFGSAK